MHLVKLISVYIQKLINNNATLAWMSLINNILLVNIWKNNFHDTCIHQNTRHVVSVCVKTFQGTQRPCEHLTLTHFAIHCPMYSPTSRMSIISVSIQCTKLKDFMHCIIVILLFNSQSFVTFNFCTLFFMPANLL